MGKTSKLRPIDSACRSLKECESAIHSAYTSLLRPTTAMVMKMLNKIIVSTPTRGGGELTYSAKDVLKLINKYNKQQRKSRDAHVAVMSAISAWLTDLPRATSDMVDELVDLMESLSNVHSNHSERLNVLKAHFGSISSREERQADLIQKHNQLRINHDAVAVKHGAQSKEADLIVDEIEENEYNLKLIEQQLARAADIKLREHTTEYSQWFRSALQSLVKRSNSLSNTLMEAELPLNTVPRSLLLDSGRTCYDEPMSSATMGSPIQRKNTRRDADSTNSAKNYAEIVDQIDAETASMLKYASGGYSKPHDEPQNQKEPFNESRRSNRGYKGWFENDGDDFYHGLGAWT